MTKEEIIAMTVTDYQAKFGRDPLDIINELDFKSQQEIENALYEWVLSVTNGNGVG